LNTVLWTACPANENVEPIEVVPELPDEVPEYRLNVAAHVEVRQGVELEVVDVVERRGGARRAVFLEGGVHERTQDRVVRQGNVVRVVQRADRSGGSSAAGQGQCERDEGGFQFHGVLLLAVEG
jgi:hypothetical protein